MNLRPSGYEPDELPLLHPASKPRTDTRCVHAYRLWLRERAWMESNNDSEPFSFVSICHALGFDAGYVRRRVLHASSTRHGPARRYASTVKDSWLRMSMQWEPAPTVRRGDLSNCDTPRRDRCHRGRCELPAAPASAEVNVGLGTA